MFPRCSLFAAGHPGASPPSVYRYIELGTLVLEQHQQQSFVRVQTILGLVEDD